MDEMQRVTQAEIYAIATVKQLDKLKKEIKDLIAEKEDYQFTYELISNRLEMIFKEWKKDYPYAYYTPDLGEQLKWVFEKIKFQGIEKERLMKWVTDLLSNKYVNCVYCGHRYGKTGDSPSSMADILYEHIKECEYHPLAKARKLIEMFLPFIQNQCTTCQLEHYSGDCKGCSSIKNKWELKEEIKCLISQLGL